MAMRITIDVRRRVARGLAGTLILVLVASCARRGAESYHSGSAKQVAPALPPTILFSFDISRSMEPKRKRLCAQFLVTACQDAPPGSALAVWTFAEDRPQKAFGASASADSEIMALTRSLLNRWSAGRGTRAAPLLSEIASVAHNANGRKQDVVVIILTDGGWNDFAECKKAAAVLAQQKNVRAVLVAPVQEAGPIRSKVEAALAILADRLHVFNSLDLSGALGVLHSALKN